MPVPRPSSLADPLLSAFVGKGLEDDWVVLGGRSFDVTSGELLVSRLTDLSSLEVVVSMEVSSLVSVLLVGTDEVDSSVVDEIYFLVLVKVVLSDVLLGSSSEVIEVLEVSLVLVMVVRMFLV